MRSSVLRSWAVFVVVFIGATLAGIGCAPAGAAGPQTAAGRDVLGGEWFVQSGCTSCHSVTAYDLWTPAVTAPDLSLAVEGVPMRFGRSLEDFLEAPTGTMAMVLSSRIVLNDNDRLIAIERLQEAYRQHQRRTGDRRPRRRRPRRAPAEPSARRAPGHALGSRGPGRPVPPL